MTININTTATQSDEADVLGGIISNDDIKTGGDIDIIPYVILNIVIFLIIIALIIISLLLKKKKVVEEDKNENTDVDVTSENGNE